MGIAEVDAGVGGWANAIWAAGTQGLTLRNAAFDTASGTSEVGAGVESPFAVEPTAFSEYVTIGAKGRATAGGGGERHQRRVRQP